MKYSNLINTLEIAAKHDANYNNLGLETSAFCLRCNPEELIIEIKGATVEEIKMFQEFGWNLGYSAIFNEDDSDKWEGGFNGMTDDQILELYRKYDSISLFV
jgi:hypothetical protein